VSTPGGIRPAIARAASFLNATQEPDGSFASESSATQQPFKATKTYRTTFAPAVILGALAGVADPSIQPVRMRLASWLLAQKSDHWSFNYWAAGAPERQQLPYPDDLDDTFCALYALHRHDPVAIDGACLGAVARLLVATETKVGGPYRTWLAAASAPAVWHDVDLAVNSNIAAFLRRVADPLPNITAMLEAAIARNEYTSPYYPSAYPLWYYLARGYDGRRRRELQAHILQARQQDGTWATPLQTALALSALRELGYRGDLHAAQLFLLQTQQADGSWPAEAFCLDPARQGRQHYNGAAALTTALAIEALAPAMPRKQATAAAQPAAAKHLYRQAFQEIAALPTPLRPAFKKLLAAMQAGDYGGEIILLPQQTAQSLRAAPVARPAVYDHLGLATMYGWLAYTIFDDFLDDEGRSINLPPATAALRLSLQHFAEALPKNAAFQQLVRTTFDRIDAANAKELAAYRAPVHDGQLTLLVLPPAPNSLWLAERSLGHTLAPLGVLAAHGIEPDSAPANQLLLAVRHYLVARQLSDDLHDWEADLRAGHLTLVVIELLRDHGLQPGSHDLAALLPALQQTFWHRSLPRLCGIASRQTAAARRAISRSGLCVPDNFLQPGLARLDAAIGHTMREQQSAKAFLKSYRGHS
jgi:hypothetical protein